MKVNIQYELKQPVSGYLNLCPFATEETEGVVKGDPRNLSEHVDDAEAEEIVALDVLDYMSSGELDNALNHWLKKLRHGGRLIVGGTDLQDVADALYVGSLDVNEANKYIYGLQVEEWDFKKSCIDLTTMIKVLKDRGLKIINKRLNGHKYAVTAERPHV